MTKILIPTDFSALSRKAIDYAIKLSANIEAELVLFYVVYLEGMPFASVHSSIEDKIIQTTEDDFEQLIEEIKQQASRPLKISYHVKKGYPESEEIESYAAHIGADLIIMGTKGASGLKKILIGSNASETIRLSSIPVLTVPVHASYAPIRQIACAIELTEERPGFADLVAFTKMFDANINLVHVFASQSEADQFEADAYINFIKAKWEYEKITFSAVVNKDVVRGLDAYLQEHKNEILAMATHKRTFFEKFYDKSITSEMAFHSNTPLFCFKN